MGLRRRGVCAHARDLPGWLSPGSSLLPLCWPPRPSFHTPPGACASVSVGRVALGHSGDGARAGRPQSSRPGQLIQRESTSTPRDWLGHARLVRANPGLLPERLRTGALLLLRLPGRQDISREPWGHLSHPSTHLPGKPRSREAEPRHRERLMLTISSKAL